MSETNRRVVVTGAGGFLGRHLTLSLLKRGYPVCGTFRSAVRGKQANMALAELLGKPADSLDIAVADLESDDGWSEALKGAHALFHTASPFPAKAPGDPQDVLRPAVEGTRRVLRAAVDAGIRRVVLTSSIAAVMYGDGAPPYDERNWTDPSGTFSTIYYASKTLAERAAWEEAEALGLELTVLCPGMILGPMIGKTTATSVGIVRNLLNGRYPAMPKFIVPLVDVRDVAAAHVLALETASSIGERFIIAGQSLSIADIVGILREAVPERAGKLPGMTVPNWTAKAAASLHPGLAMIVKELGRDNRVSSEKARRVLGWTTRPERETVSATASSLIEAGLIV
ncbi:NAD-dependent epimerase/dehydratase family protein [Rhizobium sp. NFR03]|uniref:NAD-dependent epimerase/dehydratase family protein n=1 Tax=Rhizobium sp. NFR03 TaxID=1566263 RepID=UPI0008B20212|nr:NAD-dependent epimerase/dehydratase family protein [Rhizobium sp. NFR03]SES08476.1 Nucleoside-diphosphate-sugar epimerase [Rhizobium sp. NFR03]